MLLRRVYATPRGTRYGELLKQLEQSDGLSAAAFELTPEEVQEAKERLAGRIYQTAPVRRYVLLRLDDLLAKQPGVTYQHKMITVEHVLPQNPKDSSRWKQDFTDEERLHWTHRLGNLVLINRAKNSEAQNYDFAKKKANYFASSNGSAVFALTTQVLTVDEWTPEVVAKRQGDLLAATPPGRRLDARPNRWRPHSSRGHGGARAAGEQRSGQTRRATARDDRDEDTWSERL